MLPSLPVTTSFVVKEIIHHLNWSNEEVEEAKNLYAKIHGALVHTYQYAQEANYGWILTLREKGRDAKKEGGHFKYMEYLEQKDRSQPPSGTINIMRDNYGTAIQTGQELSLDKARIKPEIKNIKTNPPQKAKATSPLEYVAWIAAILGTIVAILAGLKIWPFNK